MTSDPDHYIEELDKKGYVLLKNIMDPVIIDRTKNSIFKEYVETDMLVFTNYMMDRVNETLHSNLEFSKFRLSNNNNYIDAGGFHRDVICLQQWRPILTCLTYLDDTDMEVVEGSHKFRNLPYKEAYQKFRKNKKTIQIRSGNVLVFYATLLHRGIFKIEKKNSNRRLLQVFDCFAKDQDFDSEIVSIVGHDKRQNFVRILNRFESTKDLLNWGWYFNFVSGTTRKEDIEFSERIGYSILSSEGAVDRWEYVPYTEEKQPINKYVVNPKKKDKDKILSSNSRDEWYWNYYDRQSVRYSLLFLSILILYVLLIIGILFIVVKGILQIVSKKKIRRL